MYRPLLRTHLCILKINKMSNTTIEQSLKDLNERVLAGQLLEAFDQYYHDEVSMQENDAPPTVTKAANRQREIEFLENITEFRSAEVKGMSVGDNVSFVIWKYDYTHREWGVRNYTQVSVQYWKDGKIIRERFLY